MHSWQRVRNSGRFSQAITVRINPDYLPIGFSFVIDTLGNFLTDGAGNRLIVAND